MKEKPILFKGEMVRAILSGEKTQTRRIIKDVWEVMPERTGDPLSAYKFKFYEGSETQGDPAKINPPYAIGQKLYVKETYAEGQSNGKDKVLFYRATDESKVAKGIKWKPSIFMFKKYARIWLEVTDVRIERIQGISEEDSRCEGVRLVKDLPDIEKLSDKELFSVLWDSINKKRGFGWDVDPWVWVIEFKRIK